MALAQDYVRGNGLFCMILSFFTSSCVNSHCGNHATHYWRHKESVSLSSSAKGPLMMPKPMRIASVSGLIKRKIFWIYSIPVLLSHCLRRRLLRQLGQCCPGWRPSCRWSGWLTVFVWYTSFLRLLHCCRIHWKKTNDEDKNIAVM